MCILKHLQRFIPLLMQFFEICMYLFEVKMDPNFIINK